MGEAAPTSPSWEALLRLAFRRGEDKTRMVPIERYGPLSVQRAFYPEAGCCHVYLLHPPGGVVGGDQLDIRLELEAGAEALLTTPGAGKFYQSAGATAKLLQQFSLGANAGLEFLPLENIYFPGARVKAETRIDRDPGSRLIWWEKHGFGRPTIDEKFTHGSLRSKIHLYRAGELDYTETQRFDATELARSSGLRGFAACGSLIACGVDLDDTTLRQLQSLQPGDGIAGISRLRSDLLVARHIAPDIRGVDDYFVRLWETLRPLILGRAAVHPRIWQT